MSNLSEEEKQAIEEAKKQIEEVHNLNNINIFMTDSSTLKILLNYIDRLQKENEELDNKFRYAVPDDIVVENYVHKDKIKTKIKEYEEQQIKEIEVTGMSLLSVPIRILKELLEGE